MLSESKHLADHPPPDGVIMRRSVALLVPLIIGVLAREEAAARICPPRLSSPRSRSIPRVEAFAPLPEASRPRWCGHEDW